MNEPPTSVLLEKPHTTGETLGYGTTTRSLPSRRVFRYGFAAFALFVLILLSCATLLGFRATEQSLSRIRREHGLVLPLSAANPVCRGDAWRGFLDRVAISTFDLSIGELPQFIAQLRPTTNSPLPGY